MSTSDKLRTALSADWLALLEEGDDSAVNELVGIVYQQLVGIARKKLIGMPPQVADDEGAVISALRSFFSGVQNGQFPEMQDENDLWRVLATITARKAIRQLRVHWKQSGEAGRVKRNADIDHLVSRFSSPDWLYPISCTSLSERVLGYDLLPKKPGISAGFFVIYSSKNLSRENRSTVSAATQGDADHAHYEQCHRTGLRNCAIESIDEQFIRARGTRSKG